MTVFTGDLMIALEMKLNNAQTIAIQMLEEVLEEGNQLKVRKAIEEYLNVDNAIREIYNSGSKIHKLLNN